MGKFEIVASECLRVGGVVVIEWPRRCDYWKYPLVETFLKAHKLHYSDFDGCRYGVVSIKTDSEGVPIRKPWRIATNSDAFLRLFSWKCDGAHQHVKCEGIDTKATENYSDGWRLLFTVCGAS